MAPYPTKIGHFLSELCHFGPCPEETLQTASAALECGTSVRFSVHIAPFTKTLEKVRYKTNGCGFAVAASEVIASVMQGRALTELHGSTDLEMIISQRIGPVPSNRDHCITVAVAAFRNVLAEYRSRIVEEFQGEKALICTCFGIAEGTILNVIERTNAADPSEVSAACNAGSGCGSCRLLIQELIDARQAIFNDPNML